FAEAHVEARRRGGGKGDARRVAQVRVELPRRGEVAQPCAALAEARDEGIVDYQVRRDELHACAVRDFQAGARRQAVLREARGEERRVDIADRWIGGPRAADLDGLRGEGERTALAERVGGELAAQLEYPGLAGGAGSKRDAAGVRVHQAARVVQP